jgi:hypothetical protein
MFGWQTILAMIMPMLEAFGYKKIAEDENDTGKDDIIGQSILFGVKIFRAVLKNDTSTLEQLMPKHALEAPAKPGDFNPPDHVKNA